MDLNAAALEAVLLSLRIAGVAVLWSLPLAFCLALLISSHRIAGIWRILLDGLVHLPLILPPVVIGYLLLIGLGGQSPLGQWLENSFGIRFIFSWTGAALAAGLISLPFQVRAIRLSLEGIDPLLLGAAASAGAGPWNRLFTILIPLSLPGIVAGAMTAFAAALGEFGAIITFVSNIPGETRTLPLAIYTALQTPNGEALATQLAGLSIALALTVLIAAEVVSRGLNRWLGRRPPAQAGWG
ncbi:MAG: molybdate ABC transporter permease subunit [Pseudomonadota bacterium]